MKSMKVLCGLVLSLVGAAAQAHAHLQKAVPADGGVITASPAKVVLTFSEPAHLTACWIQGNGPKQKIGSLPTEPARQISVPMPQLAPGTYVMSWRVIGSDSHIVPGQIRFTVSAGAAVDKH
jgi:methionine-rich copper-binding protein CopC